MNRDEYRKAYLPRGAKFCENSAPNGPITQPTNGSRTQERKEHRLRMEANKTWDSKKTPAEDPNRPGYPIPKS